MSDKGVHVVRVQRIPPYKETKCANCVHVSFRIPRVCRKRIAYEQDRVPLTVVIYYDLFMSPK